MESEGEENVKEELKEPKGLKELQASLDRCVEQLDSLITLSFVGLFVGLALLLLQILLR